MHVDDHPPTRVPPATRSARQRALRDIQVSEMYVVCVHPDNMPHAFVDDVPVLAAETEAMMEDARGSGGTSFLLRSSGAVAAFMNPLCLSGRLSRAGTHGVRSRTSGGGTTGRTHA
jgi:hypothetical protein